MSKTKNEDILKKLEEKKAEIEARSRKIVAAAREELLSEHGFSIEDLNGIKDNAILLKLIDIRKSKGLDINIIGVDENGKLVYVGPVAI